MSPGQRDKETCARLEPCILRDVYEDSDVVDQEQKARFFIYGISIG